MTLLEALSKWAGLSGPALIRALESAATALPDLAPTIQGWIGKLNEGLSAENIMAISATLLAEGGNLGQGKFEGKQHSQDLS